MSTLCAREDDSKHSSMNYLKMKEIKLFQLGKCPFVSETSEIWNDTIHVLVWRYCVFESHAVFTFQQPSMKHIKRDL